MHHGNISRHSISYISWDHVLGNNRYTTYAA